MAAASKKHSFFRSSIGLKAIMAVTGLILFGFVIVHMLGNLQIFLPPEKINHYAYLLQGNPWLLWTFRAVLILSVLLHVDAAVRLTRRNRAARPQDYAQLKPQTASLASRLMFVGGLVVLAFIIFHLYQFTLMGGPYHGYRAFEAPLPGVPAPVHDVHRMMVAAFSNVWVVLFYIVSLGFLALHLHHGGAALLRSLGVGNRTTFALQNAVARFFAWSVFLGMAAIPALVFLGYVK
ncbi:MAG: succinate dehydrogenase cytochrome b subunit [Verrucomicrobium sp.]|nr:succinate dehydrogenase cytochrome b subunit [Verrucomicrobium sp.]